MTSDEAAAPDDDGERSDETLGSMLRTAREARELSIEKIADELRIEEDVLQALEDDRLEDIRVAPVFVKGYIKQYGRLLNLDYDELRESWQRQAEAHDVGLRPNRAIHLRDERQITIWIVASLIALLVAVALLVWWLGQDDGAAVSLGDSTGNSAEIESVSVAAPVTARVIDAARTSGEAQPAPVQSQLTPEPTQSNAAPTEEVAEEGAEDGQPQVADESASPGGAAASVAVIEASAAQPEDETAAQSNDAAALTVVVPDPEPGSIEMLFDFTEESWFELTDARGRRLHYDLAQTGSQLRFTVLPPARVLLGNANAARVEVEAAPYNVPASSRRGNVASFIIDPAGD